MKRAVLVISLVLAGAVSSFAQVTFYYPEIANGVLGGNVWKTTILLTNAGAGAADVTIEFTTSAGVPFNLAVTDESGNVFGGSTISFPISPNQVKKLISSGAGGYNGGYATVTSTAPISGTAIFSSFNASNGQLIGEAGVPAAFPAVRQAIIVDTLGGFRTAVAYANPSGTNASILLSLLDSSGVAVATTPQTLNSRQHVPIFVDEIFRSAPPLVGTMQISSTVPLPVVSLRFDQSGLLFTTLPPVTLASVFRPLLEIFQQRPWGSPFAAIAGLMKRLPYRFG